MTAALLAQLRASGVTIAPGPEPGTVQLALRGRLPPALRAVPDHRKGQAVLPHAVRMLSWPAAPERLETRRERRWARHMARLSAKPSLALYWALTSARHRVDSKCGARVAELVHDAVRAEMTRRHAKWPTEGCLLRLVEEEGPAALRDVLVAAQAPLSGSQPEPGEPGGRG